MENKKKPLIRRDFIFGSKSFINLFWACSSLIGGNLFFLLGLCSYFKLNFLFQLNQIQFFPQGLLLLFYGLAGSLLSLYLWSILLLSIGDGYNEFNKISNRIKIFRWGFPGKNRKIKLDYSFSEIENLSLYIRQGFNPQSILYLKLKNKIKIPLTRNDSVFNLEEFEYYAADLARFLQISLKDESVN
uniref:Photosystem I assembly protein Ycf4 n=1 Tax=Verdigellas peltata TaxID=542676 RepID=A0A161KBU8_9VIRI|nr:photosystem I assembly protein ycf4 [Verdigellas peltata]CZF96671.1 photosystem I assembly protein ycf4 [Verdigellas peltata]